MGEESVGEGGENKCQGYNAERSDESREGGLDIPTSSGIQFCHSAQERMISKKPTARTNDRRMTAECKMVRGNLRIQNRYKTHSLVRLPLEMNVSGQPEADGCWCEGVSLFGTGFSSRFALLCLTGIYGDLFSFPCTSSLFKTSDSWQLSDQIPKASSTRANFNLEPNCRWHQFRLVWYGFGRPSIHLYGQESLQDGKRHHFCENRRDVCLVLCKSSLGSQASP